MKDETPIHVLWLPTIAAAGIAYIVSIIDFIPDTFFGLGWLDDLAVLIGLIWFFTSWLPKNRNRIYWFRPKQRTKSQPQGDQSFTQAAKETQPEFDPFKILNLDRGAPVDEVNRAYKRMLSKYHPDKVAHLGEEFQHMAHDKVLDIRRAYEMLCGKG
jgi:uncharacterized membrane protein YkvA (DUF1232 family)